MSNPFGIGDLSAMGLPGANPLQGTGILETMDLVRKAWASFSLPPNMAPTMDPDEIGRRIADLKTVEQWLTMNLTMLRSTIQALEIQQATLSALQAFGVNPSGAQTGLRSAPPIDAGTGTDSDAPADSGETQPATGAPPLADALNPVAWWDMLQKQFSEVAAAALAGVPAAIDAATAAARPAPSTDADRRSGGTRSQPPSPGRGSARVKSGSSPKKAASGKTASPGAAARRRASGNTAPGDVPTKAGAGNGPSQD